MNTRRGVVLGIVLASLASACTAIVFGKVSDFNDAKISDSTGSTLDSCSLLKGGYQDDHDANTCSTCIESNCKQDVTYACNGGGSNAKPWFSELKTCAQNPWPNGFAPPDEQVSGYGCREYATPKDPVADQSDTAREATAHNCVNTNCMQGEIPPCRQCEVHIKHSEVDDTESLLRDDPCGSCMTTSCPEVLSRCCGEFIMNLVQKCAYTALPSNKTSCYELSKDQPDAGGSTLKNSSLDASVDCYHDVISCYQNSCAQRSACKP